MKHGVAFRKFSRPTAHRMLMLRNLVTSLIEHEQIQTTLPKARDAARLAEKIITLGKKGDLPAARRAQGFLLNPKLVPKVFGLLADRYRVRPGGYTRIHKYGNRPGDNAPTAILELVDNPKDLRFDMAARTIGWEILGETLKSGKKNPLDTKIEDVGAIIMREKKLDINKNDYLKQEQNGALRHITRINLQKALKFRGKSGSELLITRAEQYIKEIIAKPVAHIGMRQYVEAQDKQEELLDTYHAMENERRHAGARPATSDKSPYQISSGLLRERTRRISTKRRVKV